MSANKNPHPVSILGDIQNLPSCDLSSNPRKNSTKSKKRPLANKEKVPPKRKKKNNGQLPEQDDCLTGFDGRLKELFQKKVTDLSRAEYLELTNLFSTKSHVITSFDYNLVESIFKAATKEAKRELVNIRGKGGLTERTLKKLISDVISGKNKTAYNQRQMETLCRCAIINICFLGGDLNRDGGKFFDFIQLNDVKFDFSAFFVPFLKIFNINAGDITNTDRDDLLDAVYIDIGEFILGAKRKIIRGTFPIDSLRKLFFVMYKCMDHTLQDLTSATLMSLAHTLFKCFSVGEGFCNDELGPLLDKTFSKLGPKYTKFVGKGSVVPKHLELLNTFSAVPEKKSHYLIVADSLIGTCTNANSALMLEYIGAFLSKKCYDGSKAGSVDKLRKVLAPIKKRMLDARDAGEPKAKTYEEGFEFRCQMTSLACCFTVNIHKGVGSKASYESLLSDLKFIVKETKNYFSVDILSHCCVYTVYTIHVMLKGQFDEKYHPKPGKCHLINYGAFF